MLTYLLAQRHVVVARLRHRALTSWMLVQMASTACVRRCGMSGRYRRRATSSLCHSQANPLQPLSFVVVVDAAADSVDRRLSDVVARPEGTVDVPHHHYAVVESSRIRIGPMSTNDQSFVICSLLSRQWSVVRRTVVCVWLPRR
jgi:hypothetical protein